MKKFLLTFCVALGLGTGLSADLITLSSEHGGAATGSPKLNLDDLDLGNGEQWIDDVLKVSFTGTTAQVVKDAAGGLYAAPFVSGDNGVGFGNPDQEDGEDKTHYLSTGIDTVVLTFTTNQTYFGLLWGSVDNYNTLSFYNGDALIAAFTGTQVWANANGNQGEQGTFYVNFTAEDAGSFNRVVASSGQYAFEFDNIAYNGVTNDTHSVPEGGNTVALFGVVLAGLAWVRRKA